MFLCRPENNTVYANYICKGSIPHTSLKEIKQLELRVPDYDTQIKYGKLLNTINDKIREDQRQIDYDRNLKEAILNDLWGEDDET